MAGTFSPLMVAAGVALGFTAPLEVLWAKRLGASNIEIAVFLMCSSGAVLLVDVFGTRFVPRLEARRALIAAMLIFGISSVITGLAQTVLPVILARVIQGIGAATLQSAAMQTSIRIYDSRERAVGAVESSRMFGHAVGAPTGGFVAALVGGNLGYRTSFIVCAAMCLLVALVLRVTLPELPSAERAELGLPRFEGQRGLGAALLLGVVGNFMRSAVPNTSLPLIGDARGYSTATIGIAIGLLHFVQIVTLRSSGRIFARIDPRRSMALASLVGIAAAGVLALIPGRPAYFGAAPIFGGILAIGLVAPPLIIMKLSADAATGLGYYRIACGIGSMVGATSVNAAVAAIGAAGMFSVVGGVLVGAIALVTTISRSTALSSD